MRLNPEARRKRTGKDVGKAYANPLLKLHKNQLIVLDTG